MEPIILSSVDEDLIEVQNVMSDCFGFEASLASVEELRHCNQGLWKEGIAYGFTDTEIRERLMSAYSMLLINEPSLTYGEARAGNVNMDERFALMRRTHDERYR